MNRFADSSDINQGRKGAPLPSLHPQTSRARIKNLLAKDASSTKKSRRKSYDQTLNSFDSWLDDVLGDSKQKNKMIEKFGYKFNEFEDSTSNISSRRNSLRRIQSAPENYDTRSHKLFNALTASASFDANTYTELSPRNLIFTKSLVTNATIPFPTFTPPTLTSTKDSGICYFIDSNKNIKMFDATKPIPSKVRKQITMKLAAKHVNVNQSSGRIPIAIVKRSNRMDNTNTCTLIHTLENLEESITALSGGDFFQDDDIVSIQKYIKPKGNQAWIVRVVSQTKTDRGTEGYSYVLNDTDPFMTDSKNPVQCSIVKSASTKSWPEPREMLELLVNYFENGLNQKFKSLVGDFVISEGRWWFLQIKAFELKETLSSSSDASVTGSVSKKNAPTPNSTECPGDYCDKKLSEEDQIVYMDSTLTYQLSYKDILMDRVIQTQIKNQNQSDQEQTSLLGVKLSSLENKLLNGITKRDRMKLYDSLSVCSMCHCQYSKNKLMLDQATKTEANITSARKRNLKSEEEMTATAVFDARVKGARGAVGLDDFLQNTTATMKHGSDAGGIVGGGGIVMNSNRKTKHLIDIDNSIAPITSIAGKKKEEKKVDDPDIFKEVDAMDEGELELTEDERNRKINERVEGMFDAGAVENALNASHESSYRPDYDIEIDDIMSLLDREMVAITLGKYDNKAEKMKEEVDRKRGPAAQPRFRPVSDVAVDEYQFWTSEQYKSDIIIEIKETLLRGMNCRISCEAKTDESDLKSLMHSIYHEDEVKTSCVSGGGIAALPAVQVAVLGGDGYLKADMLLTSTQNR